MKKKSNIMIWLTSLILSGLVVGFVNLSIEVVYPSPEYPDCYGRPIATKEVPIELTPEEIVQQQACNTQYETTRKNYERTIFYVFELIGLALLIFGILRKELIFNIIGVIGGGILSIEGVIRNLNDKLMALIVLGVVIALVGYFAYKKFKE